MKGWIVEGEILVPKHEKIPEKIVEELCGNTTEALAHSPLLDQYTLLIEKGICERPRKIFPKLRPFQKIVVQPWSEIQGDVNTLIYLSDIRVSRWMGTSHSTYTLSIRLTFRKS